MVEIMLQGDSRSAWLGIKNMANTTFKKVGNASIPAWTRGCASTANELKFFTRFETGVATTPLAWLEEDVMATKSTRVIDEEGVQFFVHIGLGYAYMLHHLPPEEVGTYSIANSKYDIVAR